MRFLEEYAGYREQFNEIKWQVKLRKECGVLDNKKGLRRFMLAGSRAVVFAGSGGKAGVLEWKNRKYSAIDYKGKKILTPDDQMWGWFQQRQIDSFTVVNDRSNVSEVVVFGTKDDKYTHYPEKYGFMGRRSIQKEGGWVEKMDKYHGRLTRLNPRRGRFMAKNMGALARPFGPNQAQYRWDEIHEESGLRIKYAPAILMINQFLTTQESFVAAYLSGSQGADPEGGEWRARADHVTDHEIYRMFSGKYRERILNTTMFADEDTTISQINKAKNHWYDKNQIKRWWRIQNQN
jgi:hypothetical protein